MELVKIQMGTSLFYYVYIVLLVALFFGLYFFLRHKSKKVQYWVLFGFLAFNFALHFIKLSFPQYIEKGFPGVLRKCTFENICAVSTLIFPFLYLSKKTWGKDYMFYLGVISGIAGCVAPFPAIDLEFYQLETIRYYLCHGGIWIVPLLMVVLGIHKLDYHRIWKVFVVYFGVLGVIIVNEVILIRLGWVETSTLEDFLSSEGRDLGYAMGPPASMEKIAKYITWLTPSAWKDPYVPILWELFPVLVFGGIYAILLSMYWEHDHMKRDIIFIKDKIVELYKRVRYGKQKTPESEEGAAVDSDATPETKGNEE